MGFLKYNLNYYVSMQWKKLTINLLMHFYALNAKIRNFVIGVDGCWERTIIVDYFITYTGLQLKKEARDTCQFKLYTLHIHIFIYIKNVHHYRIFFSQKNLLV